MKANSKIREILEACPKIDIHTHLTPGRLMARGLDDILLYHMVNTELYSAGCPSGERVPENRTEEQALERLEQAVPFVKFIQNTNMYRLVHVILEDLYGWKDGIDARNWRVLHEHIKDCNKDDEQRARNIFKNLNIRKTGTEFGRRGESADQDLFEYAQEWGFFARAQWGQPDISLYELERTWDEEETQLPLPITLNRDNRPAPRKGIRTVDDLKEAVAHYCRLIPYGRVLATTQHLSTDIDYIQPGPDEIQKAIDNRENAGKEERDIYASAILSEFFSQLRGHSDEIVFQFSLGAEALPFESGSFLRQETLQQVARLISMFPDLQFMCFNASRHAHQSLCTMVRELPNFSLCGFWWHSYFPGTVDQLAEERLDMVPMNRQSDFLTDAYCADWVHGKTRFMVDQYTQVFSRKLESGQYSPGQVEQIAKAIFYDSAVGILSFSDPLARGPA